MLIIHFCWFTFFFYHIILTDPCSSQIITETMLIAENIKIEALRYPYSTYTEISTPLTISNFSYVDCGDIPIFQLLYLIQIL